MQRCLKVQLKATVASPTAVGDHFSYSFRGITQYNDLRSDAVATPRILVVLFLPKEHSNWIDHSDDALSLRRCAYWVSLRGAPESDNDTAQTVYIPKTQRFDGPGLISLMTQLSRNDIPMYKEIVA